MLGQILFLFIFLSSYSLIFLREERNVRDIKKKEMYSYHISDSMFIQ